MSTYHLPGFQSFLHHIVLDKLVASSMRVKSFDILLFPNPYRYLLLFREPVRILYSVGDCFHLTMSFVCPSVRPPMLARSPHLRFMTYQHHQTDNLHSTDKSSRVDTRTAYTAQDTAQDTNTTATLWALGSRQGAGTNRLFWGLFL